MPEKLGKGAVSRSYPRSVERDSFGQMTADSRYP